MWLTATPPIGRWYIYVLPRGDTARPDDQTVLGRAEMGDKNLPTGLATCQIFEAAAESVVGLMLPVPSPTNLFYIRLAGNAMHILSPGRECSVENDTLSV